MQATALVIIKAILFAHSTFAKCLLDIIEFERLGLFYARRRCRCRCRCLRRGWHLNAFVFVVYVNDNDRGVVLARLSGILNRFQQIVDAFLRGVRPRAHLNDGATSQRVEAVTRDD